MTNQKATIVECIVGVFAINEQNTIVDVAFFPKSVPDIAKIMGRLRNGIGSDEAVDLVRRLQKKGYNTFMFENDDLAQQVREQFDVKIVVEKSSIAGIYLRNNVARLAVTKGFVKNFHEFNTLVHDVFIEMVRKSIREASGKKDLIVSQAVLVLDDVDKTFNLFANRLREWYGYYFPELGNLVNKSDVYVHLVANLGQRRSFETGRLIKMGLSAQRAESVAQVAQTSMGGDVGEKDIAEIRSFAQSLLELALSRDRLERYLDDLMKEVAPNIRELVGSPLGARLIAAAGSLADLARKSSGTIQILGAEKALFRSIKKGTPPPKHGLLFQHKDVRQSPRWQRGKIARTLAGKLSIATRLDAYGGKYLGDKLKETYDERVAEIKAKYAEPPKKGKR